MTRPVSNGMIMVDVYQNPVSIYIYAELLLNIRQITVMISLPSDRNDTTAVTMSLDGKALSVVHNGQVADLRLPASIRDGLSPTFDPRSIRDLSLRLPIAQEAAEGMRSSGLNLTPRPIWSASSFTGDRIITCRSCQAPLVKDSVQTWKDLPSENWADMMDFWHCHKPDTDGAQDHEHNNVHKGYESANSIEPSAGAALVDVMHIHLLQKDCNVMYCESPVYSKVGSFSSRSEFYTKVTLEVSTGNKKEACLVP